MAEADRMLGMYLHLARASRLRQQPMVRDKLLILAGVQAEEMGLQPIAALCRHNILAHNAHHLVRQWPTLAAALNAEPFQVYLKQLRRRYSREKIEHMLHSLGIELGRERDAYFDDLEYAAALLDTRPEAIANLMAAVPGSEITAGQSPAGDLARPEQRSRTLARRWTPGPRTRRILAAVVIVLLALLAVALLGRLR